MSISRRNIPLWMLRSFFSYLLFFFSVWYLFETRYTDVATLGLIYGISQLVTIILEVPTGYIADRCGRKISSIVGLTLQAISWLVVGSTTGVISLWVGYLLNGVGIAFVSGAISAFDYDSLKQDNRSSEYSFWMSRANLISNIAIVFSIVVGGYMFNLYPRWTYFSVSIALVVSIILVFFAKEPQESSKGHLTIGKSFQDFAMTFRALLSTTKTRILMLYYVLLSGFAYSYIFVFALIYASEAYSSDVQRSYYLAGTILVVAIVVMAIAPRLVRNIPLTLALWGGLIVVGYVGAGLFGTILAPFWMILLYLSQDFRVAIVDQFINDEFPSRYRATSLSVLNLGASVIVLLALTLGTKGIELWGIQRVFLLAGALVGAGIIVLWRKIGQQKRQLVGG